MDIASFSAGHKKQIIVGGVVAILLIVAGSRVSHVLGERAAERALEDATGGSVDVSANGDDVTVNTDQGTWSTSGKLPDGFPTDVPLYPGGKIAGTVTSSQQQQNGAYVSMTTSDTFATVLDYFKSKLPDNDWVIHTNVSSGDGMAILGAEKDGRQLTLTITRDADITTIAVGVADTQ